MRSLSKLMGDAVHEQAAWSKALRATAIMAVFGAPVAFEDAPTCLPCGTRHSGSAKSRRARNLRQSRGVRPQLRIGLNTGAAVVGRVQQAADAGITVLGDTVNFAARLQSLAQPDSVFISEATYRLVQGLVNETFAGEYTIKGKSEYQRTPRDLADPRQGFRRWLARSFFEATQGAPSSEALQSALNVIEAKAHFDAPERLPALSAMSKTRHGGSCPFQLSGRLFGAGSRVGSIRYMLARRCARKCRPTADMLGTLGGIHSRSRRDALVVLRALSEKNGTLAPH